MKKIFLIIFLVLFFFSLTLHSVQAEYKGLVPCGCAGYDKEGRCCAEIAGRDAEGKIICKTFGKPCQLCHFFVLFDNIIDFLLFKIVPPLAILMIVIAGVMFIFAYFGGPEMLPGEAKGGPALLGQAKKLLTSVVIGLIIVYAAWLIVNLFFQIIGISTATDNPFRELPQNWWKINCPTN